MKVFESQARYELSVILSPQEETKYYDAFRNQSPVGIPEFDGKLFIIDEMSGYYWEGAPEHSWHLSIHEESTTKSSLDSGIE